jgi:AAA domain
MLVGQRGRDVVRGSAALGEITGDFRSVAEAALGLVTAEDVREALQKLPEKVRRLVLQQVKAQASRTVPPAAIAQLHRLLHGGHQQRSQTVISFLTWPLSAACGNPDDFGRETGIALLGSGVAGDAPQFCSLFLHPMPVAVRRWALARVLTEPDVPLAPLALGLLVADADLLGEDAAGLLRSAWHRLRDQDPELPEHPLSSVQLAVRLEESFMVVSPGVPAELAGPQPEIAPAELVAELRYSLPDAAKGARRIAEALADGARPQDTDLDALKEIVGAFDEAAQAFPGVSPRLSEFDRVLAVEEARQRDGLRVAALARVEGPAQYADTLAEVRSAVDRGPSDELIIFVDLLEAVSEGREDDEDALADLAEEQWPESWHRLIRPILKGRITLLDVPEPQVGTLREPDAETKPESGVEPEPPASEALSEVERLFSDLLAPSPSPSAAETARAAVPAPAPDSPDELEQVVSTPEPEQAPGEALSHEAAHAESAALDAGRLGLAAWIRVANGRPEVEADARRSAAIADELTDLYGERSPVMEFRRFVQGLSAKALKEDRAGQFMAWAACIRAGVVAPTQESTAALEELAPAVSAFPALRSVGEAFARAAQSGAYLEPKLSSQMRGRTRAKERRAEAVARAGELLSAGPQRSISYAQATVVWKILLARTDRVGGLLELVEQDKEARISEVVDRVRALRSHGAVERLIDDTARRSVMSTRNKIIASARRKLVGWVGEALDLAEEWVAAVIEVQSAGDGDDWAAGRLSELREQLAPHRDAAAAEFAELTADSSVPAPAARVARDLVGKALALLDGAPIDCGTGLPVHHLLNRDLALIPELPLEAATLTGPVPELSALCEVAFVPEPGWRSAFQARAKAGDHEGTLAIVLIVDRFDPALGAVLRSEREKLVQEARLHRKVKAEKVRDQVARWVRDGVLTEDVSATTEQTLQGLERDSRVDFGRIGLALDALEERLEVWRGESIQAEWVNLEGKRDNPRVAEAAERIAERIDAGDLTTAREFLAQVEENGTLPERQERDGHFSRFFPVFPKTFARMVARASGSRARKHDSDEVITQLLTAVKQGTKVTDPELEALLAGAGIDIRGLRGGRQREASECLRLWRSMSRGPGTAGNYKSGIDAVLRAIGVEGRQSAGNMESQRTWVELDEVRLIGSPLLPAFGSKKSPSGRGLRLLLVWGRPGPGQLLEYLKDQPKDQTVLVLYFGVLSDVLRCQLAEESRQRPGPVTAVIDEAAISYLALMPEADWSVLVSLLAPFTLTNPYAPTGGVPDEMFMGRSEQLRAVLSASRSSFVYGGRQFGKSALLRKAESEVRQTDPNRVVVFETIQLIGRSSPPDALWTRLGTVLAKSGVVPERTVEREEICQGIREWIDQDHRWQLLILLDEADWFLRSDADQYSFENVTALRDLMNDTHGRVKVVFAGLHQTTRFERLPNQPMNTHLGEPIAVGPLEAQAAFDLLVLPLGTLGFRFEENLAARVIAEANNAPALVQLFAAALLDRLNRVHAADRPIPYTITREDVDAIWRDSGFRKGITDRFEWTLNLDKRYKVIAYCVALKALEFADDPKIGCKELREMCRGWWEHGFEPCTDDEFSGLLGECVNLGVLGIDGDSRYRLRTPHILQLLGGSAEVEAELVRADSYEMPDAFDAGAHRSVLGRGPRRSPLTGDQTATLMQDRPVVTVVSGSEALGQPAVVAALDEEGERHPQYRVLTVGTGHHQYTFEGAVDRARRNSTQNLVVVDMTRTRNWEAALARVNEAMEVFAASPRGTLAVALMVPPDCAPLWTNLPEANSVRLLELRRFTEAGIRQWTHEDFSGLQGTDAAGLLEITGGWPCLLDLLAERPAPVGNEMEHARTVCADHLRDSAHVFIRSTGVQADKTLEAAWRVLAEEGEREPAEELAVLLEIAGESEQDLEPATLTARGYRNHTQLVETLRILGVLQPVRHDDRLELECEPVLADVWNRQRSR